jgi:hypothetical protein
MMIGGISIRVDFLVELRCRGKTQNENEKTEQNAGNLQSSDWPLLEKEGLPCLHHASK